MILVNSNLFLLPYVLKGQNDFTRYQKGFDNIFVALSIILLSLHGGVLMASSGSNVNLLVFVPFSVGIVLITTANTLPRFLIEIDSSSTRFSQSTNHSWNRIVRPCSYPLMIGGFSMLLCMFIPESFMITSLFVVLIFTLIIAGIRSYKALTMSTN